MSQQSTLSEALTVAQRAVKYDSDNDVVEALRAYTRSCDLLAQVLNNDHGISVRTLLPVAMLTE